MQINSFNGSLQNRYFSGTGSIGGIHLPDFHDQYVFSKKKSGISDEEYRKRIRKQAYEDFAKGQFQNNSEGFNSLMKSYTSEVSPDRKSIITSGLKAVSKNRQNALKPIDFVATLLEGKVKYQKLPSGNSDYIEFYDKKGEMVATYSTMTGRCILPMRRLPDRQKCIYVYLETVLLYMPDYKNKPENTETLMPWYDMILQRCQIKSKS